MSRCSRRSQSASSAQPELPRKSSEPVRKIVVPGRDVMKDRGPGGMELVVGQSIERRVGVPLPLSRLLENEGHDAGERR